MLSLWYFSSSVFPSYICGVHHFWVRFVRMWPFFKSNHWGSHIPPSRMVYAGCVFVATIHPSGTWTSRSFESMWWNAFVHRLDFSLDSHRKGFWWNGVRTHINSKGKIPCTRKILIRAGSNPWRIEQDSEPNTLPTSYFAPRFDIIVTMWLCCQAFTRICGLSVPSQSCCLWVA